MIESDLPSIEETDLQIKGTYLQIKDLRIKLILDYQKIQQFTFV